MNVNQRVEKRGALGLELPDQSGRQLDQSPGIERVMSHDRWRRFTGAGSGPIEKSSEVVVDSRIVEAYGKRVRGARAGAFGINSKIAIGAG